MKPIGSWTILSDLYINISQYLWRSNQELFGLNLSAGYEFSSGYLVSEIFCLILGRGGLNLVLEQAAVTGYLVWGESEWKRLGVHVPFVCSGSSISLFLPLPAL